MIVHKHNDRTDKTQWMFEAEYNGKINDKAYFTDVNNSNTYRLSFLDQEELKEFIEDLIELYNSREGDEAL
jgi:hypothetical protein